MRPRPSLRRAIAATACLLWPTLALVRAHPGQAAEALVYAATPVPTGEAALDSATSDVATLLTLQSNGAVSPATLIARARADADRLTDAMRSLGHYAGTPAIMLAGTALADPTLPDILEAWPADKPVPVTIALSPGPVFTLRRITLCCDAAGQTLDLHEGDPARAETVLAAAGRLQSALLAAGHALARVEPPIADLDLAAQAVDITIAVTAGPRVSLGRITLTGETGIAESTLRRRLLLQPGSPFDPAALEAARADLAKIPALASVRITPATATDPDGTLPVDVSLTARKRHAVSLSAAFSTDQGGNTTLSWTDRNLFGRAEILTLSAGLTGFAASAATQPGYRVAGLLTLPDWLRRDQSLTITALGVRESLDAYDRTAIIAGTTFSHRLSDRWTASLGLFGERAHFIQNKAGRDYTLAQLPLGLHADTSDSLLNATTGHRLDVTVTPTESLGRHTTTFAIAQAGGAAFFNLGQPGRSVVALRALLGTLHGASTQDIPPDQRFYGGGGGTIRGYRYESVGPALGNGKPAGGSAIAAATVEFRQRIGDSYGVTAFLDTGQVAAQPLPFTGQFRAGAGLGARYYTGIGPVRVDIAVPLIRQHNSDAVELYLGLGQAF